MCNRARKKEQMRLVQDLVEFMLNEKKGIEAIASDMCETPGKAIDEKPKTSDTADHGRDDGNAPG